MLIVGIIVLVIAIAGGAMVHPILFVLAILALFACCASREAALPPFVSPDEQA